MTGEMLRLSLRQTPPFGTIRVDVSTLRCECLEDGRARLRREHCHSVLYTAMWLIIPVYTRGESAANTRPHKRTTVGIRVGSSSFCRMNPPRSRHKSKTTNNDDDVQQSSMPSIRIVGVFCFFFPSYTDAIYYRRKSNCRIAYIYIYTQYQRVMAVPRCALYKPSS